MSAVFEDRFEKNIAAKSFADQPPKRVGKSGDDGVDRAGADLGFEGLQGHGGGVQFLALMRPA